jgi:GcrA cell cycle regulator
MSWPMEKVVHLERLWAKGLTGAQIGERLGYSRNAVLGKVRRENFPFRSPQRAHNVRRHRFAEGQR